MKWSAMVDKCLAKSVRAQSVVGILRLMNHDSFVAYFLSTSRERC